MTIFNISAALFLSIVAFYNIITSKRIERKQRELCDMKKLIDEASDQLIEDAARYMKHEVRRQKQPELFITADSPTDSKQITLKLSLDDIDIDKVQDRATREFLLKRRLMNSFCLN